MEAPCDERADAGAEPRTIAQHVNGPERPDGWLCELTLREGPAAAAGPGSNVQTSAVSSNAAGTRGAEHTGGLAQGAAGGHHVIHEEYRFPGDPCAPARPKRAPHVLPTRLARRLYLLCRPPDPAEQARCEPRAQPTRQFAAHGFRLVVPARPFSPPVKWDRGDQINADVAKHFATNRGERPPEQVCEPFPGEKLRAQHRVTQLGSCANLSARNGIRVWTP